MIRSRQSWQTIALSRNRTVTAQQTKAIMQPTLSNRQLAALKARIDFTAFCRAVYLPYQHAPHLALIQRALKVVDRYIETKGVEGIGRLRIELPPRHGKSQLVARLFPAWQMGRCPD